MTSGSFNWNKDPDVVIRQQLAVAAWLNERGELVILQQRDWCDEYDTTIVIAPGNIQALIDKLLFCMDQLAEVLGGEVAQPRRDPTAAERQRRRRQKLKEGNVINLPSSEAAE